MAFDDPRQDPSMPPQAAGVPRFQFSTDGIPERDRVPFFREELAKVLSLELIPLDGRPRHAMKFLVAGPIRLGMYQASPTRFVCAHRHLRDSGSDAIIGGIFRKGTSTLTYRGNETRAEAGDGYLLDGRVERESVLAEGGEMITLTIDRSALASQIGNRDPAPGKVLARSSPGVALLRGYLEAAFASQDVLTPGLARTFGLHIVDLLANILASSSDSAAQAEGGGVRAARLREVLASIATRAADPLFTVETIAAQLAVTTRHVHRLLVETGQSFNQHVAEQRLRRSWKLLSDPTARGLKIANVAFECGFSDLSHFNRAFRRRFGETPTAVRGAAAAAAPGGNPPVSAFAASLVSQ